MTKQEIINAYNSFNEKDRLFFNNSKRVEFINSRRLIKEAITNNKVLSVLDCSAGAGIYSFDLYNDRNLKITATDLVCKHVEEIKSTIDKHNLDKDRITTFVQDSCNMKDIKSNSFDLVLCMGAYYHTTNNKERNQCIEECLRVLKKNGVLLISYITRVFSVMLRKSYYPTSINAVSGLKTLKNGVLNGIDTLPTIVDLYCEDPQEIESYLKGKNLLILDHLAVDGISTLVQNELIKMNSQDLYDWCDFIYQIGRNKEMLYSSNHNIIVVKKQIFE